jgi:hypothetical protein
MYDGQKVLKNTQKESFTAACQSARGITRSYRAERIELVASVRTSCACSVISKY